MTHSNIFFWMIILMSSIKLISSLEKFWSIHHIGNHRSLSWSIWFGVLCIVHTYQGDGYKKSDGCFHYSDFNIAEQAVCQAIAVLAVPISWWGGDSWLSNYAYRMEMDVWLFATATLILFSMPCSQSFGKVSALPMLIRWIR